MVGVSSQQIGAGEIEISAQSAKNCAIFEQLLPGQPTQQYLQP